MQTASMSLRADQLEEAVVGGAVGVAVFPIDLGLGGFAPGGIDFAHRDRLHPFVAHESVEEPAVLFAHADEAERDLVVGLDLGGPDAGGKDEGRGGGGPVVLRKRRRDGVFIGLVTMELTGIDGRSFPQPCLVTDAGRDGWPIRGSQIRSRGAAMTVLKMAIRTNMVKTVGGITPRS